MGRETEYRFLLRTRPGLDGIFSRTILQGYLSTDPGRVVRVRQAGDKAFLTVKGRKIGASAAEFEYEIPASDAAELLALCPVKLTKERYQLTGPDQRPWDVDIFTGRHEGLMIAEIELPEEGTAFAHPDWLDGIDITSDQRFGNASLAGMTGEDVKRLMEEAS